MSTWKRRPTVAGAAPAAAAAVRAGAWSPPALGLAGLLLALSVVPAVGGVARLASLAGPPTEESARFLSEPVPVVLHVVVATLFALLGAVQLPDGLRRRWPAWHRRAGWVLVPSGLLAGLTGLWMAQRYDIPVGLQGPLLHLVRLVVGVAMVASLLLGLRAILRGQVARHRAWMIRAYALGQGAATQVLVLGPWMALGGDGQGPVRDLLMTLAWAINLALGEWVIRRRQVGPRGGKGTPASLRLPPRGYGAAP